MSNSGIQEILAEIEELLASAGELVPEVELAVEKLLNVVEALSSDKQSLVDEGQRLKQQLDQKKKTKTTDQGDGPSSGTRTFSATRFTRPILLDHAKIA